MMKNALLIILSLMFFSACKEGNVTEIKKCDSSKKENCSETQGAGNLENDVILHVNETNALKNTENSEANFCQKGYLQIDNFCVMKQESGNSQSIEKASEYCAKKGKKLITNQEWEIISQKIKNQSQNYDQVGENKKTLSPSRELMVDKKNSIIDFVTGQAEWVSWSDQTLYAPLDGDQHISGHFYRAKIDPHKPIALVRSGAIGTHKINIDNAYLGNSPAVHFYGIRCIYYP